jgi:hypothetical protein
MENGNFNLADYAAMANNSGFGNGWGAGFLGWILGAAMNGNGNGIFGGGGNNVQNAQYEALQNQLGTLSQTIADNNSNAQMRDSINGVDASIGGVNAAINALSMAFQQGCCDCKTAIMQQGYQNQLANCQQSNLILQQTQALQNTIQNGFTNVGFQMERNACDIKEATLAQTQSLKDVLSSHWSDEQQGIINSLQSQLSEQRILNAISKTTPTTTTTTNP